MKTLKFAMIAAFISCMMLSFCYADGFKEKPKFRKAVTLAYEKAVQNPGLLAAMEQQIGFEELMGPHQDYYVAKVVYLGVVYQISGSYYQWMNFFHVYIARPNPNLKVAGPE